MPKSAGVYRMLDRKSDVLYVGKAKNLRRRVANYANSGALSTRLQRMVAATTVLEIITTESDVEALLLESNLIKRLKPYYNIVLRDDKSFPYILITSDQEFPRITKYRGARNKAGEYFGPFASAGAVNQTVNALHRAFPLRSCSDSVFSGRTRPCLQHQIKRCAAPCVGRINKDDYGALVDEARGFLSGRSADIQRSLTERMTKASDALEFETAAAYRDRIRALAHILARQDINIARLGNADVIAAYQDAGQTCIQVFFFRSGQNFGNRAYYPRHAKEEDAPAVLAAFLGQFYQSKQIPPLILLSTAPPDATLIEQALTTKSDRRVRLVIPHQGEKKRLVENAMRNAREALARRLSESASQRRLLEALADLLHLESVPERIEVYDNSHIAGTSAIGSLIVSGPEGFIKNGYRKFNIRTATGEKDGINPGDDYEIGRASCRERV